VSSLSSYRCLINPVAFRHALLAWYDEKRRALPWRESTDLYRVWLSEVMLQQTRVEAATPYYLRFLDRFPSLALLAEAPEPDVLAAWSGLGYYSRARNLHRAAKLAQSHGLPTTYTEIRALPGVGRYTAAAIASIVFGEAHAAVDGNVIRVITRLTNGAEETAPEAQRLLDPDRPGDFNQALMELGATVCVPASPRCGECPVARHCEGKAAGREQELPVKKPKPAVRDIALDLLIPQRGNEIFLMRRGASEKRLANFQELPERSLFPGVRATRTGDFTHRIVNDRFRVTVWHARIIRRRLPEGEWVRVERLSEIPLTTMSRKALRLLHNFSVHGRLIY
jgi:A/G-specific adenine glycosylase